ncbi:MAG: 1-deoxy-D-xylulose-5-phosphate reductoisomerase, partial [Deltaproteobacteria bacterium]|nr:1-deoxy-D-xylulose-5-phosphate reductoisomerase [Deltaproteobacteria bacterium]
SLARAALRAGNGMPVVLNAASEIAVAAFLAGRLSFGGIARLVATVMERHAAKSAPPPASLEEIMEGDRLARILAQEALP